MRWFLFDYRAWGHISKTICVAIHNGTKKPGSIVLPGKLRPKEKVVSFCPAVEETDVSENIVANLNSIAELATMFARRHNNMTCDRADGEIVKGSNNRGLCVNLKFVCNNCKVETDPVDMSASSERTGIRGPAPHPPLTTP
jgi:hypothetical protein